MKKLVVLILIVFSVGAKAQTIIPATLTVDSLSKMSKGSYLFIRVNKDSVVIGKDTILKCPVCPAQRSLRSLTYNPATKQWIVIYNDNSTGIFVPTKSMLIQ